MVSRLIQGELVTMPVVGAMLEAIPSIINTTVRVVLLNRKAIGVTNNTIQHPASALSKIYP